MQALRSDVLQFILLSSCTREELLEQVRTLKLKLPEISPSEIDAKALTRILVDVWPKSAEVAFQLADLLDEKLRHIPLPRLNSSKEANTYKASLRLLRPVEIAAHVWTFLRIHRTAGSFALELAHNAVMERLDHPEMV